MAHNHGKRMVKENLIAEIGKDPYTEGTGIEIEDGVLSIDTSTVALKTDIPTVTPVAANTGATPTATLEDLQVGTTVYGLSTGTGKYYHNITIALRCVLDDVTRHAVWNIGVITDTATTYEDVRTFLYDYNFKLANSNYLITSLGTGNVMCLYTNNDATTLYAAQATVSTNGSIAISSGYTQTNTPYIRDVVTQI